jgi:hypothetical protein
MKLYTEEQVRETLKLMGLDLMVNEFLKKAEPIELPSNDEIKSYSNRYSTIHEDVSDKLGKYLVSAIHIDGANWMREQILNQNK